MHVRLSTEAIMGIAHEAAVGIGKALEHLHAGDDRLAKNKLNVATNKGMGRLTVSSALFRDGGPLPASATADGANVAPPLRWLSVPVIAKSIVILCEDPDAPFPDPFVHWLVYGIPATVQSLDGTAAGFPEGQNSKLRSEFTGAAPPPGHGVHHYHFQVFALDTMVSLDAGAGRSAVLAAMMGHVVAWGEIVGTYERK